MEGMHGWEEGLRQKAVLALSNLNEDFRRWYLHGEQHVLIGAGFVRSIMSKWGHCCYIVSFMERKMPSKSSNDQQYAVNFHLSGTMWDFSVSRVKFAQCGNHTPGKPESIVAGMIRFIYLIGASFFCFPIYGVAHSGKCRDGLIFGNAGFWTILIYVYIFFPIVKESDIGLHKKNVLDGCWYCLSSNRKLGRC